MGYDSEIPHMILCIIFMLIVSLNAAIFINVPILLENHHVKPMSGEDENKDVIFEKIRAFLGLKVKKEDDFGHGSSSPPPIEAPSPAPLLPHHMNPHHFRPHRQRIRAPTRRIHKQKKREHQGGIGTRTLVLVLVCGSATLVLFVILLICGCKRHRKRRRSRSAMAIIHSNEEENPQNAVKKVNSDPGSDHLYLDSLPQISHILETEKGVVRSDSGNVGCAHLGENVSVNENEGSSNNDDKLIYVDAHCSSNESYSIYNSHVSSCRVLSNASATTFSESSEIVSSFTPATHVLDSLSNVVEPPALTPLPHRRIATSNSASCSKKLTYKASSSSTLPKLTSISSSYLSQSNLKSLEAPFGIPSPPCPPPFTKNGPPPPHFGKDVPRLPKLKPLHWDKVRAAPDQSTVWDKIRSSSFE